MDYKFAYTKAPKKEFGVEKTCNYLGIRDNEYNQGEH